MSSNVHIKYSPFSYNTQCSALQAKGQQVGGYLPYALTWCQGPSPSGADWVDQYYTDNTPAVVYMNQFDLFLFFFKTRVTCL